MKNLIFGLALIAITLPSLAKGEVLWAQCNLKQESHDAQISIYYDSNLAQFVGKVLQSNFPKLETTDVKNMWDSDLSAIDEETGLMTVIKNHLKSLSKAHFTSVWKNVKSAQVYVLNNSSNLDDSSGASLIRLYNENFENIGFFGQIGWHVSECL